MDGSQMVKPHKKGLPLTGHRGRPKKGSLSTYPKKLRTLIGKLRSQNEGWGGISILIELESYGYSIDALPSETAINRYLKDQGFIPVKIPKGSIPSGNCISPVKRFHDLWEMDAQGTVSVKGLGYVSMINIKDTKSKVYCMAFPTQVKGKMSQPKTAHYFWTLRLAFEEFGLPKAIQVDRDSVFIDNTSGSPFPSKLHLFLIGLGVQLCFIDVSPPAKQAMVERSHQTLHGQVTKGQYYKTWLTLFKTTNKRRKVLNEKYPSRSLGKKAPLQLYPKAKYSGRFYSIEKEAELFDLKRVYKYLAKCCWYRKVSKAKTVSLNAKVYYLKNAIPETHIQIKFCNRSKKLIFRDDKELIVAKFPMKDFSKENILNATTEQLISIKKKLFSKRKFPL